MLTFSDIFFYYRHDKKNDIHDSYIVPKFFFVR